VEPRNGSLFIPVNNFLPQREGKTILIDAGAGNTMQPTIPISPAMAALYCRWRTSLSESSIQSD
jgi:hypothetical protein